MSDLLKDRGLHNQKHPDPLIKGIADKVHVKMYKSILYCSTAPEEVTLKPGFCPSFPDKHLGTHDANWWGTLHLTFTFSSAVDFLSVSQ